ncbi:unnamed protein product [Mesocestoides corti]|uniref:Secreted protein n=1 Tax=Mesocestoides corti TaxID=53468 RepID=A0A0R3UC60_MESCO|nr:unnamed protein product [Mesocestoides corti]
METRSAAVVAAAAAVTLAVTPWTWDEQIALNALGLCFSHEATCGKSRAEASLSLTPNGAYECAIVPVEIRDDEEDGGEQAKNEADNEEVDEEVDEENEEEEEDAEAVGEMVDVGHLKALAACKWQFRINLLVIRLLACGLRHDPQSRESCESKRAHHCLFSHDCTAT